MKNIVQICICLALISSFGFCQQPPTQNWKTGQATHYWDCNGMACDAERVPNEWSNGKNPYYVAREPYAPIQVPQGQSKYGEQLWGTFAASNKLGNELGAHTNGFSASGHKGCGKCILVKTDNAANPDFTAVLMKTNLCPPEATGCGDNDLPHIDVAVPGFDDLQYSLSNICGSTDSNGKIDTCFDTQKSSSQCITSSHNPDNNCACNIKGKGLQDGCNAFKKWGWKVGNPTVSYQVVDCPQGLVDHINKVNPKEKNVCSASSGGTGNGSGNGTGNGSTKGRCFISECSCPGNFKQNWCNEDNGFMKSDWCQEKKEHCEGSCNGVWCQTVDNSNSALYISYCIVSLIILQIFILI